MLDSGSEKPSIPLDASARPRPRLSRYQVMFLTLGLAGTGLGCLAPQERLAFIGIAWGIAAATTFTLWIGVATVGHLLNDAAHGPWWCEAWLPLRGRWLRLLVYTPLLVPGLALLWVYSMLVLAGLGFIITRIVCL